MANSAIDAQPRLDYFILDVFTEQRLQGNALAVILNPGSLTSVQMQAIARETNLSETVFVERRPVEVEHAEGIRARIFTTEEELPFAGHPTLGTASLMKTLAPESVVQGKLALALNVGTVPVSFEPHLDEAPTWPIRGEMTQRDPVFGESLDKAEVAELTGLCIDDLDERLPVQIVSTGTAFAIVALRSDQSLAKLNVRQAEASAYLRPRGARWFYVLGPSHQHDASSALTELNQQTVMPSLPWRARMQFNGGEDPATGSAAGCAISYLVRHGVVPSDQTVHLRQGIEMHRPSDLFLRAAVARNPDESAVQPAVTDVRVAGSTVLVASGQLFLS